MATSMALLQLMILYLYLSWALCAMIMLGAMIIYIHYSVKEVGNIMRNDNVSNKKYDFLLQSIFFFEIITLHYLCYLVYIAVLFTIKFFMFLSILHYYSYIQHNQYNTINTIQYNFLHTNNKSFFYSLIHHSQR